MKVSAATLPVLTAILVLCLVDLRAAAAEEAAVESLKRQEQARKIVVLVTAHFDTQPSYGAGVVVGAGTNRLYIATARHVVRVDSEFGGDTEDATRIDVELALLPGESITAKLLPDRRGSKDNDVAILMIRGLDELDIEEHRFPFSIVGNPEKMKRGDNLFAISQPGGKRWVMNVAPYRLERLGTATIDFNTQRVPDGSSGGGLFDDQLRLVGMVNRDHVAIRIDSMMNLLKSWKYPLDLGPWRVVDAFGVTHQKTISLPRDKRVSHFFHPTGLNFIACEDCESTSVFCDRWVNELEDLENKKVRVYSLKDSDEPDILTQLVEAAGGKPLPIAFNETYPALETGVIDCLMTSPKGIDRLP